MRKIFLLLLCLPLLVACGDNGEDDITSSEKTITYKFNSNAAPTGANNLIGVQIYQGAKTNSNDMVIYSPYAYGLFDDFSKIKLDLPRGHEYKIISTVIVDGKIKVAKDSEGYLKPFSIKDKGIALTNSFVLNSNDAMLLLNKSTTTVISDNKTKSTSEAIDTEIPQLDRYYGESVNYNGDDVKNPVVDMERYVFGVRMNVDFEGVRIEPNDCILLTVQGSNDTIRIYAKDEVKSIERIYTFSNLSKENTPQSIPLKVYYQRPENGELFEFSRASNEDLFRNSLMILNQKLIKSETLNDFPFKWEGLSEYYGKRDD